MIVQLPPVDSGLLEHGRHLRALREARGLGLVDLAQAAKLSPATLSLAEHGRLRLTACEHYGLESALHLPLGLIFADSVDVSRLRPL